jgi:hypothetical protein
LKHFKVEIILKSFFTVEIEHLLSSSGNGLQVSSTPIVDIKKGWSFTLGVGVMTQTPHHRNHHVTKLYASSLESEDEYRLDFFAKSYLIC